MPSLLITASSAELHDRLLDLLEAEHEFPMVVRDGESLVIRVVSDDDLNTLGDALRVAAEDWAYRASYEEKSDGDPDDLAEYENAADRISDLFAVLGIPAR